LVEITEYTLAVLVSTLLVGGSVATYTTFARLEYSSEADASLAALVGLANDAVANGHSSATLLLPTSTLTCSNGALTMLMGNNTVSSPIGGTCEFVASINGGVHTVSFDSQSSGLRFQVT